MAETRRLNFANAVQNCLTSGEYSDLIIKCGDDVYKVHKVIVCTQAGFFARAIKFGGKETQENVIDLPDDEPKVIVALVHYLYLGTYDGEFSGTPPEPEQPLVINLGARGSSSQLLNHSKMYAIADKYDVTGLRELASKNFTLACKIFWDDAAFATAVDHVFSSTLPTDTGLRSIIIETISNNMTLVHKEEIQAMVGKHSDLAVGVLLKKAS
ncbi:hypothetical protein J4E93_006325 [Alternaria ventricosa]|uniref:uncharacterized protein n=1 Tax=Alternaria ventricosa TaxID=1187951 RepID=UPI0020C59B84|nr:uncharacterized protein J4E93_006325 [Alternaria ventricosa]KAI4644423.1 hypothetical protein J4E93_006325 [Alternaria ventricosa]